MLRIITILIFLPNAAMACIADLSGPFEAPIDIARPDQSLINEAVLRVVNANRCEAGLPEMKRSARLLKMARAHSEDMVENSFFAHISPSAGKETLKQRLKTARVSYRRAAENLAQMNVFAFDDRRFIILDEADCKFEYADSRRPVSQHSYATLALVTVASWMNSKGHRRNIMDPKLGKTATAMIVDRDAKYCGDVLLTQTFSD